MFRLSGAPVDCSTSALVATRLSTGALVLVSRVFTIKDTSVPLGLQKMGDVVMGVFFYAPLLTLETHWHFFALIV